jgi:Thymidylate synthase complementing protein
MNTEVTTLADSLSPDGVRLTTLLCVYPRFIHSEMLRHRMFSHSVASSRAIPTEKNIERVRNDPFVPDTFNKRVKGMGIGDEFSEEDRKQAELIWRRAATMASDYAEALNQLGLDKSRANRILEPFLYVTDIISATEWDNFFALRVDAGAQIEFQKLATMIRDEMASNTPLTVNYGEWHLPLVHDFPYDDMKPDWDHWKRISAGRCARVSFDKQGESESHEATLDRAARLIASGHLSPFEHVARPMENHGEQAEPAHRAFCGNFRGWVQMRKEFPNEENFGLLKKEEAPVA